MERVKGIEPSFRVKWFPMVQYGENAWQNAPIGVWLLALLALRYGIFISQNCSPFCMPVYLDTNKKEVHRSTGLRADDPNDTAKAKALRAELEAKEHHRAPVVNSEGWDTWVPRVLENGTARLPALWRDTEVTGNG